MYNYTVIIPHKNCPDLLQRALASVPLREDIQTIIVDDNSDPSKVDFGNFPGLNRPNTIVVFDKSGKGAGRARNVGLEQIKDNTKWVTFLDADDFFADDAEAIFEKYINNTNDLIVFPADSVYSDTLKPANRHVERNKKLVKAKKQRDWVRYKDYGPVAKFIAYDTIRNHNLRFEELFVGNDTMFSVYLGNASRNIEVSDDVLYIMSVRQGSLVMQQSYAALESRYTTAKRVNSFVKSIGKMRYRVNLFAIAYRFKAIGKLVLFKKMYRAFVDTSKRYVAQDFVACFVAFISGRKE